MRRIATSEELDFLWSQLARRGVDGRELGPVEAAEVPKRAVLLSPGEDPDTSGLVIDGVVREYYLREDGSEHTRGFALRGDPFGSLSDALQRRPSSVFVRAETSARVLLLSWSRIVELGRASLAWERLGHGVVRDLYLRKARREYELLALDAMGRYLAMRARFPGLERRLSAPLIASYLGITSVHLSRLRRQLKEQAAR